MASEGTNNTSLGSLSNALKGRRGGIATRGNRLPSLRGPRDLTLGGPTKRTFTPNIPVRRGKPKTEFNDEPQPGPSGVKQKYKGERKTSDRGRGRGRGRGDLIQTKSIFEEGPALPSKIKQYGDSYERGPSGGGGGGGTGSRSVKVEKRDPEDQANIIDEILRDDFIADQEASDNSMTPTLLPLSMRSCHTKSEIKVKEELIDNEENAQSIIPRQTSGTDVAAITPAHIFSKPSLAGNSELLLIHLPDSLPGIPAHIDEERGKSRSGNEEDKDELTKKLQACSLSDFQEGQIGRLRVHKSGRTSLILGDTALDVSMGTPANFLQEVVSMHPDENEGSMTVLGHVEHKLLCLPDFDALLEAAPR